MSWKICSAYCLTQEKKGFSNKYPALICDHWGLIYRIQNDQSVSGNTIVKKIHEWVMAHMNVLPSCHDVYRNNLTRTVPFQWRTRPICQHWKTTTEQNDNRRKVQKATDKNYDRPKELCTSEDFSTLIYFRMYGNVQKLSVMHSYIAKEQKGERTKKQVNRVHGNLSALRVWTFVW